MKGQESLGMLSLLVSVGVAVSFAEPAGAFSVTSVTATVAPSDYTGPCPVTVHFSGVITTDDAGTVTYRWSHSPGTGQLNSLTFEAAGSKAVTYDQQSSASDFRELAVETPNEVITMASYTLHCEAPPRPTPTPLTPTPLAPPRPTRPETKQTNPWGPPGPDPGPITEMRDLRDGGKLEIHRDRAFLIARNGTRSVPADGVYELTDGTKLVLAGGSIRQRIAPLPALNR